jgi:hypothetical protein
MPAYEVGVHSDHLRDASHRRGLNTRSVEDQRHLAIGKHNAKHKDKHKHISINININININITTNTSLWLGQHSLPALPLSAQCVSSRLFRPSQRTPGSSSPVVPPSRPPFRQGEGSKAPI